MDTLYKCETCKYYKPHYYFSGNRLIKAIGHCANPDLIKVRRCRSFRLQKDCEHWEDRAEAVKERNESIKDYIREIHSHLCDIQAVLEIKDKL